MPDIIDDAQKVIDLMLMHQIELVRSQLAAVSALFCQECDEPIPKERHLAISGVLYCVECQKILELYRKAGVGVRRTNHV
ncbi:TraR/DksA family transcriptional regulator [Yersinia mollaretii]|uniref:TraR/DksA family transcriptional regulator n=1 Tax=Yersinia mollaretii TaxID=33060 RepID=UPI0005E8D949|nr:TraR/DksA family transcriptional regulator [Yersinia mollaretii]CNK96536.1 Zinc-finger containing protein [Yersinia enterocolitica]CNK99556.1 Zinc-finger containing protein [Yersinia mollaretii]